MLNLMSRVASIGVAMCVFGAANANEETTIARLIESEVTASSTGGILADHRNELGAIFEFEDLTCPFNKDGGMITKIVNKAMATVIPLDDFDIAFVVADAHDHDHDEKPASRQIKSFKDQRDQLLAELLEGKSETLTFPWYRPNCAAPAFLTDHTRDLCNNYQWSEPLYEVLIGTYLRADFGNQPRNHTSLYGRTICQSGEELPRMLRERGVSDLNARLVAGGSPKACFDQLLSGAADAAIMPLLTGARLQREHAEFEEIQSAFNLDIQMTIHAISVDGDQRGRRNIKALNLGMANLRASGVWDEIVDEFFMGHDHSAPYDNAHNH